ncbi:MAG: hypothetical protein A3F41_04790 [Coxiella sp. RIFCSPHIGHO2_12_FULL_44_14]|nr:MAG: hypothetical protein A3F41_04790 [Coxiella sp. RIFCSPHIGHO2_12_FULL_44_14]
MSIIYHKSSINQPLLIGWREWCALPRLRIPLIKAKIDTGARTSAIHAFRIQTLRRQGKEWVKFSVHPIQGYDKAVVDCVAEIIDERWIMSSNGHKEHRFVIKTPLKMGARQWDIELTLSNRDPLRFRMLLGRSAMQGRVVIDPLHSYRIEHYSKRAQIKMYRAIGNKKIKGAKVD